MGMRLCLELIENSIQQLQELEHIAALPVASSEEIETRNLNLEDASNVLRTTLTELEVRQRSLAGELDKYRELFDFAPDGYFVTDANGDILEANRAATLISEVPELTEFNIKLYLGVKEFLNTLSSFGEEPGSDVNLIGGVKTQ